MPADMLRGTDARGITPHFHRLHLVKWPKVHWQVLRLILAMLLELGSFCLEGGNRQVLCLQVRSVPTPRDTCTSGRFVVPLSSF